MLSHKRLQTVSTNQYGPSKSAEAIANNQDLLAEILVRLPVKSFIRFKSVSKGWYSFISDPKLCRRLQPDTVAGLILSKTLTKYEFLPLGDKPFDAPFKSLTFDDNPGGLKILQSCNGFLCCTCIYAYSNKHDYYIYNPTTKQYFTLPQLPTEDTITVYGVGLAFDPTKSPHYKVIFVREADHVQADFADDHDELNDERSYQIADDHDELSDETSYQIAGDHDELSDESSYQIADDHDELSDESSYQIADDHDDLNDKRSYQIEVYSSQTGSWAVSGSPFVASIDTDDFKDGVFCNGAIHWRFRLYFNVDEEKLGEMPPIPMPPILKRSQYPIYFGESRNHLHLVQNYGPRKTQFNIYEMESDYSSWFVKYHIDVEAISSSFPRMIRNHFGPSGLPSYEFSILSVVREADDQESYLVLHIPGMAIHYSLKFGIFSKICDFAPDNHDDPSLLFLKYGPWDASQFMPTLSSVCKCSII
ncbi:hypothetical protein COLO4_37345 [Corchorus olitorius]|uniref:F-box domain-containing protein n=1 Tax=Corchorus olitorius TaxID=93759 RepID=A0A1R3G2B5_9ROSI|nr:hypothetical protein COLO4_37345 [Corchorus olitorius]